MTSIDGLTTEELHALREKISKKLADQDKYKSIEEKIPKRALNSILSDFKKLDDALDVSFTVEDKVTISVSQYVDGFSYDTCDLTKVDVGGPDLRR